MPATIVADVDPDGVATLCWQGWIPLNPRTIGDFADAVDAILSDQHVKGAVLTGAGTHFLGGLDFEWLLEATSTGSESTDGDLWQQVLRLNAVLRRIETSAKPIAAAINGSALGAPLEIALACHRRVAASDASVQFGFTDLKMGLPPVAGGVLRLAAALGVERASDITSGGRQFSAVAARDAGLVDELVPTSALLEAARSWVLENASRRLQQPARLALAAMLSLDARGPTHAALESAARRFVDVARGTVARNMVRTLAVSVARANDLARRPAGYPRSRFTKVGVLGAGLMGGGIALVAAAAGLNVVLLDVSQTAAERGLARLRRDMEAGVAAGRAEPEAAAAALARIIATDRYQALHDVDIVVEAVFEDRAVKAAATRRAEAAMPAHAVFATNTSTLPISGLARESVRPQQFIGLHFFSPVPRMPLLEIIRGRLTDDATLASSMDFAQAIGKTPIVVNDSRGFYTTRVVMAYQAEAYDMLAQGAAPEIVEAGAVASGMPVPPLALSDAVGIDLVHQINLQSRQDLGDGYRGSAGYAMVGRLVDDLGRIGKKNGKGFYDYHDDGRKELWAGLQAFCSNGSAQATTIDDVRDRLIAVQALEATRCLEEGVITDPSEIDVGAILGWGFAPWTGGPLSYIDDVGVGAFVARCDALADRYGGERLRPPALLRRLAADGGTVYGGVS